MHIRKRAMTLIAAGVIPLFATAPAAEEKFGIPALPEGSTARRPANILMKCNASRPRRLGCRKARH